MLYWGAWGVSPISGSTRSPLIANVRSSTRSPLLTNVLVLLAGGHGGSPPISGEHTLPADRKCP